jgi:hypothetical protein
VVRSCGRICEVDLEHGDVGRGEEADDPRGRGVAQLPKSQQRREVGVLEGIECVGAVSERADRGRIQRRAAALQQRRQRLCVARVASAASSASVIGSRLMGEGCTRAAESSRTSRLSRSI